MKKNVFTLFVIIIAISSAHAQRGYEKAIGGRMGTGYMDLLSLSYKTFINNQGAIEFNGGFGKRSYTSGDVVTIAAAASYQHHLSLDGIDGLLWHLGAGTSIFNAFFQSAGGGTSADYSGFGFGIFGTAGIDYKFAAIPLNISADLRPAIRLAGPRANDAFSGSVGLSARYILK